MSLGPILPGRIPNSLMGANFVSDLTSIDDALNKVENQISSGQQFSLPSDNPTATIAGIDLQERIQAIRNSRPTPQRIKGSSARLTRRCKTCRVP